MKRPAAACRLRQLTVAELRAYDDVALAGVAEGHGYKAIKSRLERDHQVTAVNGTMQRWLAALQEGRPMKRPAPVLASMSIEELAAYDDWAHEKLREHGDIGYKRLRNLLEIENEVTAANDTMRRWMQAVRDGRPAMPRKRPAAMAELPSWTIEQLQPYDAWAAAKLREDPHRL